MGTPVHSQPPPPPLCLGASERCSQSLKRSVCGLWCGWRQSRHSSRKRRQRRRACRCVQEERLRVLSVGGKGKARVVHIPPHSSGPVLVARALAPAPVALHGDDNERRRAIGTKIRELALVLSVLGIRPCHAVTAVHFEPQLAQTERAFPWTKTGAYSRSPNETHACGRCWRQIGLLTSRGNCFK